MFLAEDSMKAIASPPSSFSPIEPPTNRYYLEMGTFNEAQFIWMQPLSEHRDSVIKHSSNSTRKYFVKVVTPDKHNGRFWIKVVDYTASPIVQFVRRRKHQDTERTVTRSTKINVEVKPCDRHNPSQFFVLPGSTVWEIIIDPMSQTLDLNKLI